MASGDRRRCRNSSSWSCVPGSSRPPIDMIPLTESRSATSIRPLDSAREVRICHVMSADLWAGAEGQLATVSSCLARQPGVRLSAVLLNQGRLAYELRALSVDVAVVDERRHS